jgi:hypothetical protein
MIHNKLLNLSKSKFVRVMDIILPLVALGVSVYYFIVAKDMMQGGIWLATALVGVVLSIANISKLMEKFLLKMIMRRG